MITSTDVDEMSYCRVPVHSVHKIEIAFNSNIEIVCSMDSI